MITVTVSKESYRPFDGGCNCGEPVFFSVVDDEMEEHDYVCRRCIGDWILERIEERADSSTSS